MDIAYSTLMRMAGRALARGGVRVSATRTEWDISGFCREPRVVEYHASPSGTRAKLVLIKPGRPHPMSLLLRTRCRKCQHCRNLRKREWSSRAVVEFMQGARAWLMTLTFGVTADADFRYLALCKASIACQERGVSWDDLTPAEQTEELHRVLSRDVTKFIKRLRKNSGAAFRYMLVMEPHESGFPHYHLLVVEIDPDRPVRWREVERCWKAGFMTCKLVEDEAGAVYVAKYLAKSTSARVRASVGFGRTREKAA